MEYSDGEGVIMSDELRGKVRRKLDNAVDDYYRTLKGNSVDEIADELINLVLDKVQSLTFEEPEYISNSQEHRRGYNKALDNMNIAIDKLRPKDDN